MFGMFRKPLPTADVKNALNKELARFRKSLETMETADTVRAYGEAARAMVISYQKLERFENNYDWRRGKYTWKGGIASKMPGIQAKITADETKFVDRVFLRLKWDCAGLKTDAAKERRKAKVFEEFEAYSMFFEPSTLEYVNSHKDSGISFSYEVE